MTIQAGDYVRYFGQVYQVLAVHPELGIRIVPGYEYLNPDAVEPVETEVRNSGITTGPWRWEFIGTMGNWYLVGNDGRGPLVGNGPNTADGQLMAAAPALAAEVAALKAQVETMREALEMALRTEKSAGRLPHAWHEYARAALGGE